MKTTDNSEAGYKSPPKKHQYKSGQSGNPLGRPKGSKNKINITRMDSILLERMYKPVNVNGRILNIQMIEAVFRSLEIATIKGNTRAASILLEYTKDAERREIAERSAEREELLQLAIQYIHDAETKLARCKEKGIKVPDFLVHPNDVIINYETQEISVFGPLCRTEREDLRRFFKKSDSLFDAVKIELRESIMQLNKLNTKDLKLIKEFESILNNLEKWEPLRPN